MPLTPSPRLGFEISFRDLHDRDGLLKVDQAFVQDLATDDPALAFRLAEARVDPESLDRKAESELLIEIAPHVEHFLARLFDVSDAVRTLAERHAELAPLFSVKRLFVQRKAANRHKAAEACGFDGPALRAKLEAFLGQPFTELAFARAVLDWQRDESAHAEALDTAMRYSAWAVHAPEGQTAHASGIVFRVPKKLDFMNLVPLQSDECDGIRVHRAVHVRHREGFALTDAGTDLAGALDQTHYCIWCHEQGKDSCSRGLVEKPPASGFRKSVFGVSLAGCPLEERISEFQKLKSEGFGLAALAMICVDNPMVAATGHRICNDCMKSCIYQKQDPVNIPQAETRTLKDVLELPWGFEIYSLLTRWNPLNLRRPVPLERSGRKVLVVGTGPAGFTLAHHLLNDGHLVVGIDGLKIEPLPASVSGVGPDGTRVPFEPVREIDSLREALDERVMAGFGGVAEYGITVRWDKNFLKIVRLLLERRASFALHGGVRFGGTLTVDDAFAMGFDHIALCAGAGRPTVLDLPNGLARGVRTASDFLMALQLTGAAKADSIANMQVRLPAVVIGGGLTAIDTATEAAAYYPVQVEKFLRRYEVLVAERGADAVRSGWNPEEAGIADEFLGHAYALREERERARAEGRSPRLAELLRSWGGVTIAYRRRLVDSPAYTLNHEEVEKALEEGIAFAENLTPLAVEVDEFGHASGLRVEMRPHVDEHDQAVHETTLSARTIFVAAGTQPNTVAAREDPLHFHLDGRYFQAIDEKGHPVRPESSAKPGDTHVLLARLPDGRAMSFFGDLHPSFFGNVVKAMASARRGYPVVSRALARVDPSFGRGDDAFLKQLDRELRPVIREVVRLTPNIVEVIVHAPLAARRFRPGQFYRLQNYEVHAPSVEGTRLAMEGLALTGAWVDAERGLVSTIVLEMGGSSDLCAQLEPGEPVVLMGPTGAPTEIPAGETVLLVGGGLGNAVLFSIGQALRRCGSRVLYFAGYKKRDDRYKVDEIEAASDVVIWCCDEAPGFRPSRPDDRAFVGNIVEAMRAYGSGRLGTPVIGLPEASRMIVIGSDRMMAAVARARHDELAPYLKTRHVAIGSINSPMQCMMKEICAQCLQPHVDPATGERTIVFSCFNQDQSLDCVDWHALNDRLGQNSVLEKLTARWIDRCLVRSGRRDPRA
ncbi:MAG: pyridine nucleotide-disulfide oxidoreductase [Betaproteobacteria bacterium]|nr:pyridine nucleotide-disulfide oxidoreductase [Betaproteobacteria bacterium]